MESKAGSAELERVALLSDLDAAVGGLGAEVAARVEALSRRVDEAAAEAATAARVEAVAERAEAQAAELRRAVADVAAGLDRKADLAAVDAKLGGKADRAEVEARLEALLPAAVAQAALAVKAGACQLEAAREELRHELAQRAAALEEQMAAAADASSVEALADQVAMLSARARRDADAAQSTFAALSLNYDTALTAVRLREDKLLRDVEGLHDGVRLLQVGAPVDGQSAAR